MDGQPKSMALKRERHYAESKTVLSYALFIFGACVCFTLIMMWSQVFMIDVFNSKLAYHLIMDVEDYFTCNEEYINFVIDEPDSSYSMFTFFVFNVTNSANVIERGFKPRVEETGPYGFVKFTYKYEITFDDPVESKTVTFKEYSVLQEISNEDECEHMYYRMDRDNLETNPCASDTCKCKDYDSLVTIVNPLFMKTLWEESPSELMAHYSIDVFEKIKVVLEDPFTEAVKAHLVSEAYKEIYLFRRQMQVGKLLNTSLSSLLETYSLEQIADDDLNVAECGLSAYAGGSPCPLAPFFYLSSAKAGLDDIGDADYPTIAPLLNSTSHRSALNFDYGLPRLLLITWYLGNIKFNSETGYTMITNEEVLTVYNEYVDFLAESAFGSNVTANQRLGAERNLAAFTSLLAFNFLEPFADVLTTMGYTEFQDDFEIVACSPLGLRCLWQFGYLRQYESVGNLVIGDLLVEQLLDTKAEVSTNPASLYKDVNAPLYYNSYLYCRDVYQANDSFDITCTNLANTIEDGILTRPAGLWGKENGVGTDNLTFLHLEYKKLDNATQEYYFQMSCNISYLIQQVYRDATPFHDNFVVYYLNRYKDPLLQHNFTLGNWTDLGIAQWAGGFVTDALSSVRSTNMLIRDGMWRIGQDNYYEDFIEYSSWAVLQGYPHAWFYNLDDARTLLHALARRDNVGKELRKHITYRGTTFIGDGVNLVDDLGQIGELTFTREANRGNFSCEGENEPACRILDQFLDSGAKHCASIQALFETCVDQYTFENNRWIDFDQCSNFETSETSPTLGVQCNALGVFGNDHPYTKSVGNILYQMLFSMTIQVELQEGLWCSTSTDCSYAFGGMFVTTTARKLLFNGFTEPSMMKFLQLKYAEEGIGFECEDEPFDHCGVQQYRCPSTGVIMILPNGERKLLRYGNTSNEEYFAPHFIVTNESELLWPYAIEADTAAYAQRKMTSGSVTYTTVRNPHWAAYPAWNENNDTAFNKHYQCQKRMLSGEPDLYNNCFDTLFTGRDLINNTLNIKSIHGNESIASFGSTTFPVNGSTINNQYPMYLWSGFLAYPYSYLGLESGLDHFTQASTTLFSKLNGLMFTLYQKSLIFQFQRDLTLTMPLTVGPSESFPAQESLAVRRFVEDADTWALYQTLGTPNDSYGMPYKIPIGYASLERFTNFPLYAETVHSYGNEEWGGLEYTFVTGTVRRSEGQRMYVDYDPVTGQALRSAQRQQLTLRIEAGPLFANAFSSQARCTVPTKTFARSSGYGCFAYVPLLWFEEARTMDSETFFRFFDHFYTRPERAAALLYTGIAFGVFFMMFGMCMWVNETYHRRRFKARVYVD